MFRFVSSICLVLLFAPNIGMAQTPPALVEGQRLRVAHRCKVAHDQVRECRKSRYPRVDTGYLQSFAADTLYVRMQSSDAQLAIPRVSIAQLWVVEGKKGNAWTGAGIGLVAGAVIGGVIGATQEFCIFDCAPATIFGVIIGAPAGTLLGGIVGSQIRSDRWRPLPVDHVSMSAGPRLDAVRLQLSVAL